MKPSETTWSELAPNLSEAKKIWKWAWEVCLLGFASIYILIGLYTVFNIFTRKHFYHRKKKLHVFFLSSMVLIFSSTRATVLLWDAYVSTEGSSKTLMVFCVILNDVATSCLTSTFSVLLLMVLDTTKLSVGPPRFQKPGFLIGIWVSNVVYILISDFIVASFNSAKAMIFVSQVLFAFLPCLMIFVGSAVAAYKLRMNLNFSRKTSHCNNNVSKESIKMHQFVILLYVACIEGFCLFILSLYKASGEPGLLNDSGHMEIWQWLGLPMFLRFVELLMCAIIFLIAWKCSSGERRVSETVWPNSMLL